VKRRQLITKVDARARAAGRSWIIERRGGRNDLWRCGATLVTIPRHREINEITARAILKELEVELGDGWWR
jgi:mRNA interferase HicA